jgi:hypothetical protein
MGTVSPTVEGPKNGSITSVPIARHRSPFGSADPPPSVEPQFLQNRRTPSAEDL